MLAGLVTARPIANPPHTSNALHRRQILLFALFVAAAFVAIGFQLLDRCLDDDAFISFRYARNLVRGDGLVYNAGERVEGYTNFLWTLVCAAAIAAGAEPATASQFLGLAFGVATLFSLVWIARRGGAGRSSVVAPACVVALLPFTVEHLIGLEMPLFVFLVVLGVFLHSTESRPRGSFATGAVFALAAMTRPEGMMIFGLSLAVDAWPLLRRRTPPWRRLFARAGGFVVFFAPYFAWRYAYYGFPFPNTYYVKTGTGLELVELGARYVGDALSRVGPFAAFALVLVFRRRELPRFVPLTALVVLAYLAYLVVIGGDFRHHFRFFVPVVPLVALLAVEGARRLIASFAHRGSKLALSALFAACVALAAYRMHEPAMKWVHNREVRTPQLFAVGTYFRDHARKGALMAISGGGVVPYVSDLPAIEMWGLTDLHIARTPIRRIGRGMAGHMKGDGAYILRRKPRYIVFLALMWTKRPATHEDVLPNIVALSELDLHRDPRFAADYTLRSAPLAGPTYGFVNFFERNE
jgi:hypothetical protein